MKKNIAALAALTFAFTCLWAGGGKDDSGGAAKTAPKKTLVYAAQVNSDEVVAKVLNEIFTEYEKQTGTKIDYQTFEMSQYRTWLTTQFTGGNGPDVYNTILYEATSDFEKGWVYNMKDLVQKENPYDKGKKWIDTLPDGIKERTILNSSGDVAAFPTSTSVVRIFMNMDLFKKAGVQIPQTWAEFMTACDKLQKAGIVPFAFPNATIGDLSWLWFSNSVCGQLSPNILKKLDESGNGYVEVNEMAKGIMTGTLDFNAPELRQAFTLMKDFSKYWTSDYNSLDQNSAIDMFLRGQAAMVQVLSGTLRMINEMATFPYAVMPVPVIMKSTSPYAMEKSVVLGGQPDLMYTIGKTSKNLPEAIDFAQYMSSPAVQKKLLDTIYRIPMATTISLPKEMAGFTITEEPLRIPYFTGINEQIRTAFHRAGQQYLQNRITLDDFVKLLNQSYRDVLGGLMTQNKWTAENNYGIIKQ